MLRFTHMRAVVRLNILALLAAILFAATATHAESVVWNTQKTVTLYTPLAVSYWYDYFGENLGSLSNPNITIQYHTRVTNADTGAIIPCGSIVPEGTHLSFDFIPHEYTDVYWFATGWSYNSPYGEWRDGASSPPTTSCEEKDFVGTRVGDRHGQAFTYNIYSALVVAPPIKKVSGVSALSCGTPESNGSVDCTANTVGTIISKFDFGPTIGKFYGRLWSPPYFTYENNTHGCYGSNTPMVTGSDTRYTQPEFGLDVPAQSISCPITVVSATDGPTKPVVTAGACTVGTTFTVSFTSTDPNGRQLKYGVDWDADGSVDQWVPPSRYVNSGTTHSASRTYSTIGRKSISVFAVNDKGAVSSWATQTFACAFSVCPAGYTLQGNTCVLANQCATPPKCSGNDLVDSCTGATIQSCSYGCASGACVVVAPPSATLRAIPSLVHSGDTTTVSWASQNTTSCIVSDANGESWAGISSSGKTSRPILAQTIYTLHCVGLAGATPSAVDKSVTVNLIPSFNEK